MVGTFLVIPSSTLEFFPRPYINRVVVDAIYTVNLSHVANVFHWTDQSNVSFEMVIRPNFWQWSTIGFSWDYVIDAAASSCSIAGVGVTSGVYFRCRHNVNGGMYEIYLESGGGPGLADFATTPPAPPDYWLPQD